MIWIALLGVGCADVAPLDAEVASLRKENAELRAQMEAQAEQLAALEKAAHPADLPPPPEWLAKDDAGGWYVIRSALPSTDELTRLANASPHRGPDGEYDGYRISAVRRFSALALLGFANGDVVQSVNGTAVVDAESVLAASLALGSANEITVRVIRRGEPIDVVIRIQ